MVDRQQHGEEAAEQVAGGQQAREEEDPLPTPLTQLLPGAPTRPLAPAADHRSTPITVVPPVTRSPTRTVTSVPRGM